MTPRRHIMNLAYPLLYVHDLYQYRYNACCRRDGMAFLSFLALSDMGRSHLTTLFCIRHCMHHQYRCLFIHLLLFPFLVRLKDFGQKQWGLVLELIMGMASWFRRLPTQRRNAHGQGGRTNGEFWLCFLWKEGKKGRTTFYAIAILTGVGCGRLIVWSFGCFASCIGARGVVSAVLT